MQPFLFKNFVTFLFKNRIISYKPKQHKVMKNANTFTEALTNGANVIQSTTNFEIFRLAKYNRGLENSIDPKRLKSFREIFDNGEYFTDVIHVFVNLLMLVIDGHHKLTMHKKLAEEGIVIPINFVILTQKEFNEGTDAEILGAISRFNAKSSKWDGSANFNAAFNCSEPLALAIADLKGKYDKQYGFKKNLITASRIYALLTKDIKGLASISRNVEDYCNKELLNVITSKVFLKEFEFVCAILARVNAHNKVFKNVQDLTAFYFIRHIMPKVWNNELNMGKFLHNFEKRGLKNIGNTMSGIGLAVDEIAEMKVKKSEQILELV